MILIADSGATKTDWILGSSISDAYSFRTRGLNLALSSKSDIDELFFELSKWEDLVADEVKAIYFYSAGAINGLSNDYFYFSAKSFFSSAKVFCDNDLLAASRALFGTSAGLVAILGTGSNSAYYDGEKIVKNIRPGGFILGDEGSAASLGKNFLSDFIKGLLPSAIQSDLETIYHLDYPTIVQKVYKEANPSRFLGSLAPYIYSLSDDECVDKLIRKNLTDFVERVLLQYDKSLDIGVVGSFGAASKSYLSDLGRDYGLNFVKFLSSPIEALLDYHLKNV